MAEVIELDEAGIVVLHDDERVRAQLTQVLPTQPGFRLLAVGTTAQAAEILSARSPEVVILGVCPESSPPIAAMSPRCMVITLGPAPNGAEFAHLDDLGPDLLPELRALLRSFRRALTGETVLRPPRSDATV